MMNRNDQTFNWIINKATWPPHRRPSPPFGPGAIEILRSCPLRACFDVSDGYEPRMGFAARVGIAFHRTVQSFVQRPLPPGSLEAVAEEGRARFLTELRAQEAEADSHPRERGLPRDRERVNRAAKAIVLEAQRFVAGGQLVLGPSAPTGAEAIWPPPTGSAAMAALANQEVISVEVEIPVSSKDGLFQGRVDRAHHGPNGVKLLDFKSALRDDLPERYQRQLQLYAYMWYDTRGEWPVEAEVVYPLAGTTYRVSVQPELCRRVATESAAVLAQLESTASIVKLGTPSDVCKVCEFRPWCAVFWGWQSGEQSHKAALEKAGLGFEGPIITVEVVDYYWKLRIGWRGGTVQLITPRERLPQLNNVRPGMWVRVLDCRLHGHRFSPQVDFRETSELFLLAG